METQTPTSEKEQIKIMIGDKNYTSWYFTLPDHPKKIEEEKEWYSKIQPTNHKLFTKDVIELGEDGEPRLVYSHLRKQNAIAGVLLLENNKTFGRNETKKRLLYKCVPDDIHLPCFLVPYELKLGFSKQLKNKFVLFKFDHWKDKHPHGILVEVLGDVDQLDVFYEYQLYCKSLHVSMNEFNNKARDLLKKHSEEEYIQQIKNHPNYFPNSASSIVPHDFIFTIDPSTSTDFDDAFSIQKTAGREEWCVRVYIANVYLWLETLDLWKSFSKRVSTIYLPDRKRPMLPTVLSDCLCSLQEKQQRFAFVMEVVVHTQNGVLCVDEAQTHFFNSPICVSKNFVYEEAPLYDNPHYQQLLEITQMMEHSVKDSHDVVSYWMVLFNRICGSKMAEQKVGIFRSMYFVKERNETLPPHLSVEARRTINMWNNTIGQYCLMGGDVDIRHNMMNIDCYVHITSPIRRLVDLLNQMIFVIHFGMIGKLSQSATHFLEEWKSQMEYINTSMRSIRKVQTDCEMLKKCIVQPDLIQQIHNGVVFDKVLKNDGMYSYVVYLEQLKLLSKINTSHSLENYSSQLFKMFIFQDEHQIKKKIKLCLVEK